MTIETGWRGKLVYEEATRNIDGSIRSIDEHDPQSLHENPCHYTGGREMRTRFHSTHASTRHWLKPSLIFLDPEHQWQLIEHTYKALEHGRCLVVEK